MAGSKFLIKGDACNLSKHLFQISKNLDIKFYIFEHNCLKETLATLQIFYRWSLKTLNIFEISAYFAYQLRRCDVINFISSKTGEGDLCLMEYCRMQMQINCCGTIGNHSMNSQKIRNYDEFKIISKFFLNS